MNESENLLTTIRDIITDSIQFWELRRLVYNAALGIVTGLIYVLLHWLLPEDKTVTFHTGLTIPLFLLAVAANLLYCLAYPIDLCVQISWYRASWRRYRQILFLVGTLIACILTVVITLNMFSNIVKNGGQILFFNM